MFRFQFVIFLVFVSLSTLQYTQAKGRGGHSSSHHSTSHHSSHSSSHSYPSSHGLSGGGGHNSGGLSGGHGYPSSGGSHSYPSSHGISGSSSHSSSSSKVHYHYHYTPPQRITYTYGGSSMTYPVYVGQPPIYVYEYRDSGSVYGSLLAGLALYNLGSVNAHRHSTYKTQPDEVCKFGVKKSNGDYEETKIKCEIITSFIFEDEKENAFVTNTTFVSNSTFVSTTVTNTTSMNVTNGQPNVLETATTVNSTYTMLPNGTLIPQVSSQNVTNDNGTIISMKDTVTVTTTNTTVTVKDAVDVKGKEIEVTPQTQCYVIRHTCSSHMKKSVPCGLLQSYAAQSLKKNSGPRFAPAISLLVSVLLLVSTVQ